MYKDFLVGKLFRIVPAKGKCTRDLVSADGINYVAAKKTNNGVADRCSYIDAKDKDIISEGNCIVFVQLGDGSAGYTTYQPEDFVGMNGKIACGYIDGVLNEKIGMYLMATLDKNKQLFSYSASWTGDRLRNTVMSLPIKVDEDNNPILDTECKYHEEGFIPDFDYMQERIEELEQERIEELEQERIEELEQYLVATGLNDYELTDEDIETLSLSGFGHYEERDSEDVVKVCKEFKIIDIARVEYGNKFDKNKMTYENPSVNFVSRTASNNGISDFVDNNGIIPYKSGLITLALGGSIGSCFLQEYPFYTGQNVGVIDLGNVDYHAKIYFTEALGYKCKKTFTAFGNEINKHLKTDLSVSLPIQTDADNNPIIDFERKYHLDGYIPDWDFMERYIRAIEKIVIADVVKYKDAMIAKAKEVVA